MADLPDMTEWLAARARETAEATAGKTEMLGWAGKPVTDEDGEVIGSVTGGHTTERGDIIVEMRF